MADNELRINLNGKEMIVKRVQEWKILSKV